jgi:hypothetical protein
MDKLMLSLIDTIEYSNIQETCSAANAIGDMIYFKTLYDDVIQIAESLMEIGVKSSEPFRILECFRLLEEIFLKYSHIDIPLNILDDFLGYYPNNENLIANVLLLYGYSGKRKYLEFAKSYLTHPNEIVRKNAKFAIKHL